MAAAAILHLLFLSIFIKWSISSRSRLGCWKIFFHFRQLAAELLLFVQKSMTAAAAILDFIFFQHLTRMYVGPQTQYTCQIS